MKGQLNMLFAICLVIFSFSCSHSKKDTTKDKRRKTQLELATKYNADVDWDSIPLYSFHYQEMFIEQNKPMIFAGRIYDIEKKDSNYVVKVLDERENASQNFLALVSITPQQFNEVYSRNKSTRGIFVIQVSKVFSSNPSIKEDEEEDGDEEDRHTYTFTHLSDDGDQMLTIFRGKLIDFRLEEIEENK